MITLTQKYAYRVPLDAENIAPNVFAGKSLEEIRSLPIWEGNRRKTLCDLFSVGSKEDTRSDAVTIRMVGDFTKVKRIGAKMSFGRIVVKGSVGFRLGEEMSGGEITVTRNAGSWAGMMMKGGEIQIAGDAGDYVGAAYRGSKSGMKGGVIGIRGDAGNDVGYCMADGLIKIGGNVGQFAGVRMTNGAIFVEGDAEGRVGAEMVGGRVVVMGKVPSILPSFIIEGIRPRVRVGEERMAGPFYLFKGDVTNSWRGSLYVAQEKNPHLKIYESKIV